MKEQSVIAKSRSRLAALLLIGLHYVSLAAESLGPFSYELPPVSESQEMLILHWLLAKPLRSIDITPIFLFTWLRELSKCRCEGALTRLGSGDMFYESPEDICQVSRNASNVDPTKFLMRILKPVAQAASVPLE
jgi:hypothetical protein